MTSSQLLCKKYKCPTLWWRNWSLRETTALQGGFFYYAFRHSMMFWILTVHHRRNIDLKLFLSLCIVIYSKNQAGKNKIQYNKDPEIRFLHCSCIFVSDSDIFFLHVWSQLLPCCLCESLIFLLAYLQSLSSDFFFYDFMLMPRLSSLHYHLFSIFSLLYSLYYLCPLLLFSHFIFCPILSHFAAEYCFYIYRLGPIVLLPAVKDLFL